MVRVNGMRRFVFGEGLGMNGGNVCFVHHVMFVVVGQF